MGAATCPDSITQTFLRVKDMVTRIRKVEMDQQVQEVENDLITQTLLKVAEYDEPEGIKRGELVVRNLCIFLASRHRTKGGKADLDTKPAFELIGDKLLKTFYPQMLYGLVADKLKQNQGVKLKEQEKVLKVIALPHAYVVCHCAVRGAD